VGGKGCMSSDKKINKIQKSRLLPIIVVIIVISLVLTSFYLLYNDDESKQLDFTIQIIESDYDILNKQIYYRFENLDDGPFNYSEPEVRKNLDFFIIAENGTKYHYSGPATPMLPLYKILSPGEIKDGNQTFGYKSSYLDLSEIRYTNWMNASKNEYWFFQPGTYKVYGIYESKPNEKLNYVLVGIWRSNTVILTVEPKFIEITTDKERYLKGENVTIYMKNISDITLNQFSGWENYSVMNYKYELVYQHTIVSEQLTELSPDEKVTINIWHQTFLNDTQVPPGYYIIIKYYSGHIDETGFYIQR
jgi:hypothetical protein